MLAVCTVHEMQSWSFHIQAIGQSQAPRSRACGRGALRVSISHLHVSHNVGPVYCHAKAQEAQRRRGAAARIWRAWQRFKRRRERQNALHAGAALLSMAAHWVRAGRRRAAAAAAARVLGFLRALSDAARAAAAIRDFHDKACSPLHAFPGSTVLSA